jgi:hypothetical protein
MAFIAFTLMLFLSISDAKATSENPFTALGDTMPDKPKRRRSGAKSDRIPDPAIIPTPTSDNSKHDNCLTAFIKRHGLFMLGLTSAAICTYQIANMYIPKCNQHADDYNEQACLATQKEYLMAIIDRISSTFGFCARCQDL